MCVILREAAHPHHPVQHAAPLVTVDRSELGVAKRQIAVRALTRLVDADVTGTVHRLRSVAGPLHIHRAEHVLPEVFQVP